MVVSEYSEIVMLPVVNTDSNIEQHYLDYLSALESSSFNGDIETSHASRFAVATDNSIYQSLPQAVIFPSSVADLQCLGQIAVQFPSVVFSARGGGTGTNGQSLTSGIVVDLSRHMNQLIELNVEQGWVKVQAGMVKDALNDILRPHGYFFSPDLSTSNRATIGGMINTDASGQGSLVYGKTSDHVLGLTAVLADGAVLTTEPESVSSLLSSSNTHIQKIAQQLQASCIEKRAQILAKFPRLNRFLTGYDLEHAYLPEREQLDISRIIAGSEGSLAFVAEAKLNLTPIAKQKVLINIQYDSFEAALRHAPVMIEAQATSVETIDSKVLGLAKNDIIWHSVADMIQEKVDRPLLGLNMVEYNSDDEQEISARIASLRTQLDRDVADPEHGVITYQITNDLSQINKIYAMRKKAVGLLGKTKGRQKPIAFAEDTAVPPENLADFILEFRDLLDQHGLQYGMFGHVDAGVLHVRPALDMNDPQQEVLLKTISDEVVALVAKYGGLMWGEHGKGYRSEYSPAFFGPELYAELCKIKAVFDPHNQMNPGKICTPFASDAELVKVSAAKRGTYDRTIPITVKDQFTEAMDCNGNGLCFNYDTTSPMCPSFKVSGDRRHSPKGRASMIREWLRLLAKEGVEANDLNPYDTHRNLFTQLWQKRNNQQNNDFAHEVYAVMDECLACKSCSSQCPVGVDVPDFRAKFLSLYHQRYLRPMRDYLVANVERLAPYLAKLPKTINFIQSRELVTKLLKRSLGYVDTPQLSTPSLAQRSQGQYTEFNLNKLKLMAVEDRAKYVLVVQDPFTSFYDATVVADFMSLIRLLGYEPILLPFHPNGKPQHVKGFLSQFAKTAANTAQFLNQVASLDLPMVGVDASLVLVYRDEYVKVLGAGRGNFHVLTVHEWLADMQIPRVTASATQLPYALFTHCTEKTALPTGEKAWQQIYAKAGLDLELVSVGCCGMAGTYGHEAHHLDNATGIYRLSWQNAIQTYQAQQRLVTGYSCRSQVARYEHEKPQHPLQALLEHLNNQAL